MKRKLLTTLNLILFSLFINPSFSQTNALNFDGINDYVSINPLINQFVGQSQFTVEFWIKPDANQLMEYAALFSINSNTANLNRMLIRLGGTSDGINATGMVVVNIPNGGVDNLMIGNTPVLDNQCHHIAYTYNGGLSTLYVDGILQATLNYNYSILNSDRISLGQEFDPPLTTISQLYKGEIDKLRIWNILKTQSEVQQLMTQTITGAQPNLVGLYNFDQGISNGNNTSETSLIDNSGNAQNGTLINFTLTGTSSNFVQSDCGQSSLTLSGLVSSQFNTNCNGTDCNYSGPSILINELMISPTINDGSISGNGGVSEGRGEWIELYNPDLCESVDISCYYLGNNTPEGNGGFVIPAGTIIPPSGFCMIRGFNVDPVPANLLVANGGNVVEIVVPYNISDPGVCAGGTRLWFPNAGGWFAFYDSNGVPQDAVSWLTAANSNGSPCVPTLAGCNNAASLPSYDAIPANRKNYLTTGASLALGLSVSRTTDGGAWGTQGNPTYAECNGVCIQPGSSSCTGTATVNVSGGTPPYTYAWDDSQAQTTQTAIDLCAGTYNVTVTDNVGATEVFQVTVTDFIPTVSVNLPEEICVNANPVAITVSPIATAGQTGVLSGTGVNSNNFSPAAAGVGNHTVTYLYEDQFGCSNSATDAIIVNPLPAVSITNNQSPYCVSNTPAGLVLSPSGGQLTGTGVVNNQFIPAQAGVGSFTLTYTYQDANGCSNSTTVNVQVVSAAPATLTLPSDLCIDADTLIMIANPGGGNWQIDGTASSNQFISPNEGVGSHAISYTLTDGNGCITSATGVIMVHALPDLQIPLNSTYCYETGFHPINPLPAGGVFTGDNVFGNGINVNGVNPGAYTVFYAYTDQFGCASQEDADYSVTSPFSPGYAYETNCFQNASFISTIQNPAYTYSWNIGNSYTGSGITYNQTFIEPGTFPLVLTVTDNFGCSYDSVGTVEIAEGINIEELVMPNIITPNGDNVNDRLEMPALLTDCFHYEVTIVNRWGNIVYTMDSNSSIFDGRSKNGNDLSEGVYFYSITSDDFDCKDEKYKGFCFGNITIVR